MRTLRIFQHISLDGVIAPTQQGENSDYANGGWTAPYRSPAGAEAVAAAMGEGYDLLLGRRTYNLWASYWPNSKDGLFATSINAATKYVATHHAETLTWGPSQDLGVDIVATIRRLKSEDGPDLIVWGSSTLIPILLQQRLVDEMVLALYPILLGPGKRVFLENAEPRQFTLTGTQSFPTGLVLNTYRAAGNNAAT